MNGQKKITTNILYYILLKENRLVTVSCVCVYVYRPDRIEAEGKTDGKPNGTCPITSEQNDRLT